jgi:Fatty acid desaturase
MAKVSFSNNGQLFYTTLKKAVDQYFSENKIKKTGDWRLYIKALIFLPLAVAMYFFILYGTYSAFAGIMLSIGFGLVLSFIAFNVMHDANHGSFSTRKWVNEMMGYTMNILGSDAYIWKMKHNILHHTYTNVDGLDDDMSKSPILRMSPTQRWVPDLFCQHHLMGVPDGYGKVFYPEDHCYGNEINRQGAYHFLGQQDLLCGRLYGHSCCYLRVANMAGWLPGHEYDHGNYLRLCISDSSYCGKNRLRKSGRKAQDH